MMRVRERGGKRGKEGEERVDEMKISESGSDNAKFLSEFLL
jgi:hypothetical protein